MYYQHFSTAGYVIHEWIAVEIDGNFPSNFLTRKYIIFHHTYFFKNFYWDVLTADEKVNVKPVCA